MSETKEVMTGYYNTNTGDGNIGNYNSGYDNDGDRNTGSNNTGSNNTGDWNTGNRNSGYDNTGDRNTGDSNYGNGNTGDRNTGDRNSGDWNKCNFSNGCFNTIDPRIHLFNKPSEWTYEDWRGSKAHNLMSQMMMMDAVVWWCGLSDEEKAIIKAIPNFDKAVFKEITGVDVDFEQSEM